MVSASIKAWLSRRGETAALIICMPTIRIANPRRISPMCFFEERLDSILSRVPAMAATAAIEAEESSLVMPLAPSI